MVQGVVIAAILSVIASLVASYIWAIKFERRLTTISVPVFIRGQDAQGGQFALGVVRAMDHAARHGGAEVDGRRIEPVFIDEDAFKGSEGLDQLVKRIKNINPPIVVGPLTSSASQRIVPQVAGKLHIPMILGIPTSMTAADGADGYAWRLSPKNDEQAKAVAEHYFKVRDTNDRLIVVQDRSDNSAYSDDLVAQLMPALNEAGRRSAEKIIVTTRGEYAQIDHMIDSAKTGNLSIIYVGMPDVARDLVAKAAKADLSALWIFTDGCITDKGLIASASRMKTSRFFVTFQGPPAVDAPGLQRYMWYVRNTGGHVSFAVENSDCAEDLSASSYEIFGFDSYLLALKAIRIASDGGKISPKSVNEVLARSELADPFFLLGPYKFANGDSTNLRFHVYQIAGNCVSKWTAK
jgi:ABC-type branched-subunit amino acid transport system substrate-binding protein